ncbi:peroxisomal oxidase [Wolfiporia cocos MD-104 SS10]|uniref:Acyl-coenzyme A oxidase n=1 Tax=Wolfiporia cocos (strain MD-104) TaxID=742152 RepID=A0A2H3JZB0_WOLCO|nr:peroxisomal oxidase [Wolfiporia cocos MD-104 SS10]
MTTKATPEERTKLDMAAARATTSIDVPRIRDLLYDGRDKWETSSRILRIMSEDPVFDKSQRPFMNRQERYKRAVKITNRLYELQGTHKWSTAEARLALDLVDEELPMHLSAATFEPVFMEQCGPYLRGKYGDLVINRGIQGCYLQTELGHGTDVGSLETTATYIPETKEFEIHSPTLTSSKWWIGALGRTATHGVVQAKLILPGGKDMGPHMFLVQLRSLQDHTTLPGITVGDIGPKVLGAYVCVDNGFARFDRVRIPRENMLSAYSSVTDDGKYVKPPHSKLGYGGMLWVRAALVGKGGWYMARAATVAIRYCTVRRQSNKGQDGLERQVISYPSVQYRLLPVLSYAYVFILLGRDLMNRVATMSTQLAAGNAAMVPEMHITSSALKILVTSMGSAGIETARRAMGGHGFSEFSGLGRWYADWLPTATYEGDNYVLDLQVVRGALKAFHALARAPPATASPPLPPSAAYLRFLHPSHSATPHADAGADWADHATAVTLLERRAAALVQARAASESASASSGGESALDADMDHRISRAAAEAYLAMRIGELVRGLPGALPAREAVVVGRLLTLGLLALVEGGLVDILSFGLLRGAPGADPSAALRIAIKGLCAELVPEAIGLTDAFGFTDWQLDSALGVEDGSVYQQLWARAQAEPLNATEPVDGYKEYIKPMLERGQRVAAAASKAKL